MFLYPSATPVSILPRVRLGEDGNVYFDMHPNGFIVMSPRDAMAVWDGFNKVLSKHERSQGDVLQLQRRKQDLKQPPLFPGRETPSGRTDFDKEDDATGA